MAQQISGGLSGTATDPSGAAVGGASVELRNEASGDRRVSVTNNGGFFAIEAIPPGTYSVKILAAGFNPWEARGIVITQGDSRKITDISLKVGDVKAQVSVVSEGESVAPVDTGAVSTTLNAEMIDNFTISGRDVGELMKIMPGMGTNSGLNGGAFNGADHVTGSNSGPAGSFSANGTIPNGGMAYMLDGANLLDSNMGTQIANINPEMVAEVKMNMSSYGAEYAKGPIVFQAFSKSGGNRFHGEGYFFARNSTFNSIDSYQKNQGLTDKTRPDSHYYYPGGNIGGPIVIPGLPFNRNHDKLFFWFGYEYMDQHPAGSFAQYFLPTPQMAAGNFTPQYISTLKQPGGWSSAFNTPCGNAANGGCPGLTSIVNGQVPISAMDPNGLAYYKLFPTPNVDPATHGGYNYQFINSAPQNRWEASGKVDYAVNDSTKLSVAYTFQRENDAHPIDTWWAPNQALPYPSAMVAQTPSKVLNINFTKVFSPTLVNEVTFADADYVNATTPINPAAINPSKLGMTYQGLFGAKETQLADTISWSGALAEFQPQASFGGTFLGGKFGAHKYDPSFADNLSKVVGTHSLKFGFYWDRSGNTQSTTGYEGQYEFETYGSTSTNNVLADLLTGHASAYSQTNSLLAPDSRSVQWSLYAQDQWKVSERLTVNLGLRMDHIGQYYNPAGNGAIVFDPALYSNAANAPANTGLVYHKINSSIPLSGWKSPLFYPAPRLSFAYDLFGNGKTVIRGGASLFRFQVGSGTLAGADANSNGQFSYGSPGLTSFTGTANLTNLPVGAGALNGGNIFPLMKGDDRTPNTWDYNFTISEAAPYHSLLEFSYVGTRSRDLAIGTSNNQINNLNIVGPGTYFKPDPITGITPCIQGVGCTGLNTNDYFPLRNYQNIRVESHGSYSNYNSLQVAWTKRAGPVTFVSNYVFGKVLGTIDGVSGNGAGSGSTVDSTALSHNYAPLAYDHTHIFNVAYSVNLPKPIHNNAMLAGVVNGWQLSGWTGIQSGVPLQPNTGGNLNVQWGSGVNNSSYLGTNAIGLQPQLICDPRKNLSSGQYFNPACFAPPAPGTNGTVMWPYIHGPATLNSDLSLFKSFRIGENKKFQLRFQAYNFLNHPNPAFALNGNNDVQLNFGSSSGALLQANRNLLTNGKPGYTQGNRLIEVGAKFYF